MSFRPTELTLREVLLDELKTHGVRLGSELSVTVPSGRRAPDAVLLDGGEYVLETKVGEANYYDDVLKLAEWMKYRHIPLRGAFAVLMPEKLRRIPWDPDTLKQLASAPDMTYGVTGLFRDERPGDRREGSLAEIAEWIAKHVLEPPKEIEPDISFFVGVLSGAVDRLNRKMRGLKTDQLDDIFGGESVFHNILEYEEGKFPLEEMRKAASYLLINQLLFYSVLSQTDSEAYPAIDTDRLKRPSELTKYFNRVLEVDYAPTFGFDIASRLKKDAADTIRGLIEVIQVLGIERIKHDLLGKVFHNLIPYDVRKAVAAFYTNSEAAELLASLAIDRPDVSVADLAVGSGTLLVAAYRRKRKLLKDQNKWLGQDSHHRFVQKDLTGIDIMPFSAHLAVVHLSLQAPQFTTEKVRIAIWDSIELKPGMVIPPISKELSKAFKRPTLDMFEKGHPRENAKLITKGAITAEGPGGEAFRLEPLDVVIMNPPFTRFQRLPVEYKKKLSSHLPEYKKILHGQMGLYSYFILLADRFLRPGGRVALVLPAAFLRAWAAIKLRKKLLQEYHFEYIVATWQRAAFSESAAFREILLVAKKRKTVAVGTGKRPSTSVVMIDTLPEDTLKARELARTLQELSAKTKDNAVVSQNGITLWKVPHRDLVQFSNNLFRFIALRSNELLETWVDAEKRGNHRLISFRDYLKRVKGDLKEGIGDKLMHAMYVVSDEERLYRRNDRWVVDKQTKQGIVARHVEIGAKIRIPRGSLVRGLKRFTGIDRLDISETTDFVIKQSFKEVREFVRIGTGKKDTGFLQSWGRSVGQKCGNLLPLRRFNVSAPGTRTLAYYCSEPVTIAGGMMWAARVPDEDAKILTLWWNSSLHLLQILMSRSETEGAFFQLDEFIIEDMRMLDPDSLDSKERKKFLELFDQICTVPFSDILSQMTEPSQERRALDQMVLKTLGYSQDEIGGLLDNLYRALAFEIKSLADLMGG